MTTHKCEFEAVDQTWRGYVMQCKICENGYEEIILTPSSTQKSEDEETVPIGLDDDYYLDDTILGECNVPTTEAGVLLDGVCFIFLLLQRRIIKSHYFKHVVAEFRAQQVYASRGAELIEKITNKELQEQMAKEQELVDKLMRKMNKIKAAQKSGQDKTKKTRLQRYVLKNRNDEESSLPRSASETSSLKSVDQEKVLPVMKKAVCFTVPEYVKGLQHQCFGGGEVIRPSGIGVQMPKILCVSPVSSSDSIPFITSPRKPALRSASSGSVKIAMKSAISSHLPLQRCYSTLDENEIAAEFDTEDTLNVIDQPTEDLVPDAEVDRRKGLGPLQLLNIAMKKGTFKSAVEDALQIQKQQEKLERKASERNEKVDQKKMKNIMRQQIPGKMLANFEEDKFEQQFRGERNEAISLEAENLASEGTKSAEGVSLALIQNAEDIAEDTGEDVPQSLIGVNVLDDEEDDDSDYEETATAAELSEEELEKYGFVKRNLLKAQEFLTYFIAFLKLFLIGVIESAITWLLKLSREYRYVAHVLSQEKAHYKQHCSAEQMGQNSGIKSKLKLNDSVSDS